MSIKNTIFALATAPGKSGVAIMRLSGPEAKAVLIQLSGVSDWAANLAQLVTLRAGGSIIDRALAIFFAGPKSFTGEDVAELHIHGSLAIIRELLGILSRMDGLRPAEPGEFTRRAFLNGKLDLIEAEGLADLIDAETPKQKSQALRQMQGSLSQYYDELRLQIVTALAHLEAYIDFPDEEIPGAVLINLSTDIDAIKATIQAALADHQRGEKLRDGIRVVILGAPNAGKSSLLNAIAGRDAAIVSHRAGTTRDVIEIHMDIAGFPVILTDTAGLRDSTDDIEEEGIRRALARAGEAALKLVLFDGASPTPDARSMALLDDDSLCIVNKSDIQTIDINGLKNKYNILPVSAKTGQGMGQLLAAIGQKITASFSSSAAPVITRNRHRALLLEALDHLSRFNSKAPLELSCEELRLSAACIGKITGKISVDDVLDVIFRQFCIGK